MLGEIAGMLGLGSAVQDLFGQEFNSDEATAGRNHSAEQAQRSREWQEAMRSSNYQAAVQDMKLAGLNPMLAYQQGGATTPGAPGVSSPTASRTNLGGVQQMQTAAQIRNVEAQTENIKADTDNKRDENPNIRGMKGLQDRQMDKLRVEVENILQQVDLNVQQTRKVYEEVKNAILEGGRIQAHTGNIHVDTLLKKLEIPESENKAAAQRKWEWYMRNIRPFADDAGTAVNSAARARDMFRPTHRPNAPQRPNRTGESSTKEISDTAGKGRIRVERTRKDYHYDR